MRWRCGGFCRLLLRSSLVFISWSITTLKMAPPCVQLVIVLGNVKGRNSRPLMSTAASQFISSETPVEMKGPGGECKRAFSLDEALVVRREVGHFYVHTLDPEITHGVKRSILPPGS